MCITFGNVQNLYVCVRLKSQDVRKIFSRIYKYS